MLFTGRDVITISTLVLLFTLILYHLFIYFGRKGSNRRYYVYFCFYAGTFFLDLLVGSVLHRFFFPTEEVRQLLSPGITGLFYFSLIHFSQKMLGIIFNISFSKNNLLLPYYISFILYGISVSFYLFVSYEFYLTYIFPFVALFAFVGSVYVMVLFTVYFFKDKRIRTDISSILILLGYHVFMIDFFLEEILELVGVHYIFKDTYMNAGLSVFAWAFALAVRFNKEHRQLMVLNRTLEVKVVERTRALEQANEERVITLINLAHETKTPLTIIKNMIVEYSEKFYQAKGFSRMLIQIDKLSKQIGDILNVEEAEKGDKIFIHDKVINLSSFLNMKLENFNILTEGRKVFLKEEIEQDVYIKSSPDALDALIDNLINNAIKFTIEGSVFVSLKLVGDKIQFIVKDTGVGIPEDLQSRIFEPFFHYSNKNVSGHGIGLSYVRRIIESFKGNIDFSSKENEGTEFIVYLPGYKLNGSDDVYSFSKPENVSENQYKIQDFTEHGACRPYIYIVEDNHDLLNYLLKKLKVDFNVYVSDSAEPVLKRIEFFAHKPSLIISDIMMGGMSGMELLEEISQSEYNYIPFVFLTAKSSNLDKDKALALGAIDFISKPFDISEVIRKCFSITNQFKLSQKNVWNQIRKNLNEQEERFYSEKKPTDNSSIRITEYGISAREKDVLFLIKEGVTYQEVADKLNISKRTVDAHMRSMFKKVEVNRMPELISKVFGS